MRCRAAAPLCHFSSFVILSLLLAAVLRAFVHSCSYSCQLFLSFCLGSCGKLFLFCPGTLFCLYKVAHFIAGFFAFRFGTSVMHGHFVEALS